MRIVYLAVASVLLLLITVQNAFSASVDSKGEIYSLSISPEELIVLEPIKINIGVLNPTTETNDYTLKVFVIADGQIKLEQSFSFSLKAGRGISFSPDYVPDDIGEYEIIVDLYDKYETTLYDTKIEKINVISDIGPFDLDVDVLSGTVAPGDKAPVIIRMANMGEKGTDVKIRLYLDCFNQSDIVNEFWFFLEPMSSVDRVRSIETCRETGMHEIQSHLVLFNRTWISSVSQFLLSNSVYKLSVKPPQSIEVRQGTSSLFSVFVENIANMDVSNLKLVVEGIPSKWVDVKPSEIIQVKSGETVIFLVNITAPQDASAQDYPLKIEVGGAETLTKKETSMKILSAAVAPISKPKESSISLVSQTLQLISNNKLGISMFFVAFAIGVAIVRIKKGVERTHAVLALKNIKNVVGGIKTERELKHLHELKENLKERKKV